MLTAAVIAHIAPACKDPHGWVPVLEDAAWEWNIRSPVRIAYWLAQLAHESAQFNKTVENLNYSAEGLMRTWPTRFKGVAQDYEHQPARIASRAYAGRMGNRDEASGDGWRYRGRGLIQITFHTNYLNCGDALKENLVANPEKLETPILAARSAGWYWGANALHRFADQGDFKGLTRAINGAETGMADREQFLARAIEALDLDSTLEGGVV